MGGPGNTSSDILGIEIGRRVVRGVRLDQETTELTAASECLLDGPVVSTDGVIDPEAARPSLEYIIEQLGVRDRAQVRVGFSIGPRNGGVGSGPSMSKWLETQAANLREHMICSGGLGISFAPSRAVDAALKLASDSGIDLVRVDLAPVAGARAIGGQVDDAICLGSGRGWQARMRDFEVLEAMENPEIGDDDTLSIIGPSGHPRYIARYGWVEISAELDQAQRLDIGQLAPAVGAAIGVAYESPANLLMGKEVACRTAQARQIPGLAGVPSANGAGAVVGEETLQLTSKVVVDQTAQPGVEPRPQRITKPVLRQREEPESDVSLAARTSQPVAEAGRPEHLRRISPPRSGGSKPTMVPNETASASGRESRSSRFAPRGNTSVADSWGESVDESDPITMFSPENDERNMLGKRESRIGPNILIALLVLSAAALAAMYLFL